jgi:DNA-binding NarL/FixJ family response regulator
MRILLVDDHGLFLEGLQNLLYAGGYSVVGIANDGLAALEYARLFKPDLVLMDIRMPKCDGLTATRLIHAELPEIKIVMLTTSAEDADLFDAIKSGASGYLLKNLKAADLFDYLKGLERGEAPLSRELSAQLLREFNYQAEMLDSIHPAASHYVNSEKTENGSTERPGNSNQDIPEFELTPRQRQILEMIANGMSYKEAGAVLHVSENTIKYHMGEIIQRLHVKNREQVVAYALRSGLVKK